MGPTARSNTSWCVHGGGAFLRAPHTLLPGVRAASGAPSFFPRGSTRRAASALLTLGPSARSLRGVSERAISMLLCLLRLLSQDSRSSLWVGRILLAKGLPWPPYPAWGRGVVWRVSTGRCGRNLIIDLVQLVRMIVSPHLVRI